MGGAAPGGRGPVIPKSCVELAEAYVEPSARGEGISESAGHRAGLGVRQRPPLPVGPLAGRFPACPPGCGPPTASGRWRSRLSRTLDGWIGGPPGSY